MLWYSKNCVLLLFANWSDFVTVGPVLPTQMNFQFLSKTNTMRIFLLTSVKQSVLRHSKHRLFNPGTTVSTLSRSFQTRVKTILALNYWVTYITPLKKAYFLRKYLALIFLKWNLVNFFNFSKYCSLLKLFYRNPNYWQLILVVISLRRLHITLPVVVMVCCIDQKAILKKYILIRLK